MKTHEIPFFDVDGVGVQDMHQRVVADRLMLASKMGMQVDHHAAPLHACPGHVLHTEAVRADGTETGSTGIRVYNMVTVVIHRLRFPVAIGVEQSTHMGKAVPLG